MWPCLWIETPLYHQTQCPAFCLQRACPFPPSLSFKEQVTIPLDWQFFVQRQLLFLLSHFLCFSGLFMWFRWSGYLSGKLDTLAPPDLTLLKGRSLSSLSRPLFLCQGQTEPKASWYRRGKWHRTEGERMCLITLLYLGRGLHSLSYTSTHLPSPRGCWESITKEEEEEKAGKEKGIIENCCPLLNHLLRKTIYQEKQMIVKSQGVECIIWILDHLTLISDHLLPKPSPLCPSNCSFTMCLPRVCSPFFSGGKVSHEHRACLSLPPSFPLPPISMREYSHRLPWAHGFCFEKVWDVCSVRNIANSRKPKANENWDRSLL